MIRQDVYAKRHQGRHSCFDLAARQRVRILETAGYCSRGGTGRRVRLRTVWGNPWRFESSREHIGYFKGDVPFELTCPHRLFFSPPIGLSSVGKASSALQR